MVDTRDLKSLGQIGCAGSSPALRTNKIKKEIVYVDDFLFTKESIKLSEFAIIKGSNYFRGVKMEKALATNKRNTIIMMIVFVFLVGGVGWLVGLYYGDHQIAWQATIGAFIYALIQYFLASRIALWVSRAKPIAKNDNPRIYEIVDRVAKIAKIPAPKIHIINDPALNAFATGRDPKHASVAFTTGILEALDDTELEAVTAHEIGHIANYDIRLSMIIYGLVSIISLLGRIVWRSSFRRRDDEGSSLVGVLLWLFVIILAPLVALIIQLAISRQREYLADATSVSLTGDSSGLKSALSKLGANSSALRYQDPAMSHMYINGGRGKGVVEKLFSTHPPIEERIKRIELNAKEI